MGARVYGDGKLRPHQVRASQLYKGSRGPRGPVTTTLGCIAVHVGKRPNENKRESFGQSLLPILHVSAAS